jgi:hypothetical protein
MIGVPRLRNRFPQSLIADLYVGFNTVMLVCVKEIWIYVVLEKYMDDGMSSTR